MTAYRNLICAFLLTLTLFARSAAEEVYKPAFVKHRFVQVEKGFGSSHYKYIVQNFGKDDIYVSRVILVSEARLYREENNLWGDLVETPLEWIVKKHFVSLDESWMTASSEDLALNRTAFQAQSLSKTNGVSFVQSTIYPTPQVVTIGTEEPPALEVFVTKYYPTEHYFLTIKRGRGIASRPFRVANYNRGINDPFGPEPYASPPEKGEFFFQPAALLKKGLGGSFSTTQAFVLKPGDVEELIFSTESFSLSNYSYKLEVTPVLETAFHGYLKLEPFDVP